MEGQGHASAIFRAGRVAHDPFFGEADRRAGRA